MCPRPSHNALTQCHLITFVDKHDNPHIRDLLAQMHAMHPRLIDLSLQRITRLLKALGNPHHTLARPIHIAGTNGKGSTYAFLKATLGKKYRTINGYTSPHLTRFNERIMLHNDVVDDKRLGTALEACIDANHGHPMTFFEMTTAAAFLLFHRYPADVTLIECGMGGRFDATNVLHAPIATIITPISLDHQRYLGTTLSKIAQEKAGIMKRGVPCIIGKQYPKIRQQLEQYAQQHQAPSYAWGTAWHHQLDDTRQDTPWHFYGKHHYRLPPPSLKGRHQYDNAALAVACIDVIEHNPQETRSMVKGIGDATWHGRLHHVHPSSALMDSLPKTLSLWLDGGHNHAAARALRQSLPQLSGGKKWALIFGMLRTKDPKAFIKTLRPYISALYTVPVTGEGTQARDAQSLKDTLRPIIGQDIPLHACASLKDALSTVGKDITRHHRHNENDMPVSHALICGSLYLIGEALTIDTEGMRTTTPPSHNGTRPARPNSL
ncbi:MAG: bifunctional folylpolyglutamate synthase/dihydrofolate synthase [Alphaproteobacteria bacterium GM7ARS4]|nr:bifunctional folylpolyglutamate synthase/dihydrofolate synthase [Alphaproteobacteria bacterium GM7ARS4]